MGYLFLAFLLVIVGEIFLIKLYGNGGEQLEKYDKEHSDIEVSNFEEFVSKLKAVKGLNVNKVDSNAGISTITFQGNKHKMNVENGKVSVEYDMAGCQLRISSIGRILKAFKFGKTVKRAVLINSALDSITGRTTDENTKQYKKVSNSRVILNVSIIAIIVFCIMGISSFSGGIHEEAIEKVKATEFYAGYTYGDVVERYVYEPEWSAFNSDTDVAIVEMNGTSIENETICIQFSGELGMGFNSVGIQDFKVRYFELDGESLNPESAMIYICDYYME